MSAPVRWRWASSPMAHSTEKNDMNDLNMKHWRLAIEDGGIAVAILDKAGESANSLSAEVMAEFGRILDQLDLYPPKGLIVRSGKEAGFIAGAVVTGVLLAVFMANAGGAWDNAKKYIEGGEHGGKGSVAHKAAVVGDTVGDPFKDTSSPAMNILIKLMTVVSLVFAPVIYQYGGILVKFMK